MWKLKSTSLQVRESVLTVLRKHLTIENKYFKLVLGLLNNLLKYLRDNSLEQYLGAVILIKVFYFYRQIGLTSIFACFGIILLEYCNKGKENRVSALLIVKMS